MEFNQLIESWYVVFSDSILYIEGGGYIAIIDSLVKIPVKNLLEFV
jgi:hypothetical protein